MTREETSKVLSVIRASYPQFFAKWDMEQRNDFLNLWTDMFVEDDPILVMLAVKAFIRSNTSQFPPSVGQIVDLMQKLSAPKQIDADTAWNMVFNALRDSLHNSKAMFDALPKEVQAGIGSHEQLKSWASMSTSELQTVVASNFKRGYRGRVEEHREFQKLPTEAKNMIEELVNSKRIENQGQEDK